jgi:tagatose 1,6-diphosphate aldolase GatY/KbaY
MKLQEKLLQCKENSQAILACNFYNFETLKGICLAAQSQQAPVILQLTRSSIDYMGLEIAVKMGRAALEQHAIEGWIHLDHGDSVDLAYQCLKAGFDSVMIDASEKTFEENVETTRKVVSFAKNFDANVEAELGYVAKLGQTHNKSGFTEPAEAKAFVEETGINALAIAIGSAHGFYTKEPVLDLERLSRINEITPSALVLHGGSGIPGEMLQEAIRRGICKINLATEIKNIFMRTLADLLKETKEIDLRKVFPPAINAVKELVQKKMELISIN